MPGRVHLEVVSRLPEEMGAREISSTPLLFVHGAWHGAWCWQEHFLPYFAQRGYRAHALSLRGHGASEGRHRLRWTRQDEYVDDVAQVAASFSTPPVVVGHSMGGLVVQKYLTRHPAAAAALLASVPPGRGAWPAALRVARRHPVEFARMTLELSLYPVVSSPRIAADLLFSANLSSVEVQRYWPSLQDESYLGFLDMLGLSLPDPRRVPRVPMLVLAGTLDRLFSPEDAQRAARAYGAELQVLPGLAHDLMLDADWETVAQRLAEWLRRSLPRGAPQAAPATA